MRTGITNGQVRMARQGSRDRGEAIGTDILREAKGGAFVLDYEEEPVGAAVGDVRVYVPGPGGLILKETVSAVAFRERGGSLARHKYLMSMARGRSISSVRRSHKGRPKPKPRWGAQA